MIRVVMFTLMTVMVLAMIYANTLYRRERRVSAVAIALALLCLAIMIGLMLIPGPLTLLLR